MAQFAEIIETEKIRNSVAECRTARLYREGSFLRAYEWSAWLFVKFVHDFKVSNRNVKSIKQSLVMIGFPVSSIAKYTPEGADVAPETDGCITVTLSSLMIPDDADIASLAAEYNEWKGGIPIVESKPSKSDGNPFGVDARPASMTSILQRIMAYPLEQKSPMESMIFLSEIKRQIASLI